MTVKKIWMPPTSGRKNRYAVTTLGSILGIALLMLLLIAGGITLSFALSLPREVTAVVLCLGVTLLGVGLALRVGRRSVQEATVFFLTQDDKLYVLDARQFPYQDYRAAGYVANAAKTQQFLQNLAEKPFFARSRQRNSESRVHAGKPHPLCPSLSGMPPSPARYVSYLSARKRLRRRNGFAA